ncbi:DUF5908 family protein [Roseomonas rosulenta]|uniref:DUF5908 family protein n=1 Tax=Roseomonas rosulenta TaxID=2748667 RepID=UPI0018E05F46|nr:DUF5908 family protein [Roseomonas rosulenta]
MPIEIKELQIKVTVPPPDGQGAAVGETDLLLFQATPPDGWDGKDAEWRGADATDALAPDPAPADAAPAVHHSGGVNMTLGDGSVRILSDGFDLFS